MTFIPLRLHSHWSLLDGVPSLEDIVACASERHLPAIALTDANTLYGAVEFVGRCQAVNLQPILGVDFTFERDHSLILLARDLRGYGQLCRLVTRLQAAPDREAQLLRGLSLADVPEQSTGLIALSDGHQAEGLRDRLAGDAFFIVLPDGSDASLARQALADRLGVPTVAAPDVRYLTPAEAGRYRVLTAMRTGQSVSEVPELPDYALPTEDEIQQCFAAFPQALANTALIAERCRFEFPLGQYRFPTIELPAGRTLRRELWERVTIGAQRRYGPLSPPIEARLRKEIDVINTLGYAP